LEAAILLGKRNSSLIEFFCIDDLERLKLFTETVDIIVLYGSGTLCRLVKTNRKINVGKIRGENTGMSNVNSFFGAS